MDKLTLNQLIENRETKEIGEFLGYQTGDTVRVNIAGGDLVEIWQITMVNPFLPDERNPDRLFFMEELPKIVDGEFKYIQYHDEQNRYEAVIELSGPFNVKVARKVDQAVQSRFGACWKLWIFEYDGKQDLHVMYWRSVESE